jgi:hypothetical protein
MTPKEKAKELVSKCWLIDGIEFLLEAKQCALIAVDEIDNIYQKLTPKDDPYNFLLELEYWQEVKQQIIKL